MRTTEATLDEAELARLEAEADQALLAPATGHNSLYREWARRAKLLANEVRRLQRLQRLQGARR